MRDKVLSLSAVPGAVAIRVERKDGRKYFPIREFGIDSGAAAWVCAVDDASGSGGRYRFSAIDSDGEIVGSHRHDLPRDEEAPEKEDRAVLVEYLSRQNNALMGMIASILQTQAEFMKPAPPAKDNPNDVGNLLGSMIGMYMGQRQQEPPKEIPPGGESGLLGGGDQD